MLGMLGRHEREQPPFARDVERVDAEDLARGEDRRPDGKRRLAEPDRDAALHLFDRYLAGKVMLIAPDLLLTELASVVGFAVHQVWRDEDLEQI